MGVVFLTISCQTFSSLSRGATRFEPPPIYEVLFNEVRECMGAERSFKDIKWFEVPPGYMNDAGKRVRNNIFLETEHLYNEVVVIHEIIHFLRGDYHFDVGDADHGHPAFVKCGRASGDAFEIINESGSVQSLLPPAIYELWTLEVQECAQLPLNFTNLRWFIVPEGALVQNGIAIPGGARYPYDIYLEQGVELDEVNVKQQIARILIYHHRDKFSKDFLLQRSQFFGQCTQESEFITPLPVYREWFDELTQCSNIEGDFGVIRWKTQMWTEGYFKDLFFMIDAQRDIITLRMTVVGDPVYVKRAMLRWLFGSDDMANQNYPIFEKCAPPNLSSKIASTTSE